jgi:hypothetical protein
MSDPEIPNKYGEVLEAHGMSPLRTPGYVGRLYDLAAQANRPVILCVEVNFLPLAPAASAGI